MTLDQLLIVLLVGLVAGFLATHLVAGHGYGLMGDVVIGILGSLLGWVVLGTVLTEHLLTPLGVAPGSVLGMVIVGFVGAAILLLALRLGARRVGGGGRAR